MDTEKLLKSKATAEKLRQNWLDIWDELAYYVLPARVGYNSTHVPGERFKWSRRFDSTAGQANKTLANHIHMALTSPSQAWFEGVFADPELNQMDVAKEWSEEVTHEMFSAFNYSNFNGQINTFYQILCCMGTSVLTTDFISTPKEPFSLVFRNISMQNVCFDVDMHERIDTVYQDFKITRKQAIEMFGDRFKKEDGEMVKITKCTYPNPNSDPTSIDPKKRPYLVTWIHEKDKFKSDSEYELPYHVVRFEGIENDPVYGEGPGLLALSDIRSLNKAKYLEFRGYEKAIDPPLMGANGGVIGDLNINAGGYTQVRDPRMLGEMPGKMDINLVMIKGEELRDSIRNAYKINELLVPERKGQNPATATEIQIRYEQMQKMMGATVGRIEAELLKPMVKRVFGIMYRNGRLPDVPEELAGQDFDFRYVGPLAKSQVSADAVAIERAMQASMGISQLTGRPSLVLDYDKAERVLYDRYSTPAEVIRSEKEVKELQQQQAQAAQEQAAQEQQMQQAQGQQMQAEADMADVELMQNVQGIR